MSPRDPRDEPWTRTGPARGARQLLIGGVLGPLIDAYARVEVAGCEVLDGVTGPVVLVANHSSHVDTPILLRSLPGARRRRTLVAAAADYFYVTRRLAVAVSLAFGTIPVRRRDETGASSLDPLARLIGDGWSLVLFAEGTRSRTGALGRLRTGAAALSARTGVPLVPVHIGGTAPLMGPGRAWMTRPAGPGSPRRHPVTVRYGEPLAPGPGDDLAEVMTTVRRFMEHAAAPGAASSAPCRAPAPPPRPHATAATATATPVTATPATATPAAARDAP